MCVIKTQIIEIRWLP